MPRFQEEDVTLPGFAPPSVSPSLAAAADPAVFSQLRSPPPTPPLVALSCARSFSRLPKAAAAAAALPLRPYGLGLTALAAAPLAAFGWQTHATPPLLPAEEKKATKTKS